jgi:deoxyribodipyrimidine photo-lyase
MEYTLFIFRRDLRIEDNTTLNYAMNNYKNIIPIFIFTPEQVTNQNKFKNDNAIQFMCESLKELNLLLQNYNSKLHYFYGDNIQIIKEITKQINIVNILTNMDYTPYALNRDQSIKDFCILNKINFILYEDYLLNNIGTYNKIKDKPYSVFTPFKNYAYKFDVNKPKYAFIENLNKFNFNNETTIIDYKINNKIKINGGRIQGLIQLNQINQASSYNDTRNQLSKDTSLLSAYIKFGCISIREVYWKIYNLYGITNDLLSQVYWREFYTYIGYYNQNLINNEEFFQKKFKNIKFNFNQELFQAWCDGKTGFPVVDAGMRELNETGFMHNRARLITSNFLNRIFGFHYKWSEFYYAKMLLDYDPYINNGNHQWTASVGVDPKPFNQRLFNPWLQSKKFDEDCTYIKKWIPELKNVFNRDIHNWSKNYLKYDLKKINYVKPIVNYEQQRKKSIEMYKNL